MADTESPISQILKDPRMRLYLEQHPEAEGKIRKLYFEKFIQPNPKYKELDAEQQALIQQDLRVGGGSIEDKIVTQKHFGEPGWAEDLGARAAEHYKDAFMPHTMNMLNAITGGGIDMGRGMGGRGVLTAIGQLLHRMRNMGPGKPVPLGPPAELATPVVNPTGTATSITVPMGPPRSLPQTELPPVVKPPVRLPQTETPYPAQVPVKLPTTEISPAFQRRLELERYLYLMEQAVKETPNAARQASGTGTSMSIPMGAARPLPITEKAATPALDMQKYLELLRQIPKENPATPPSRYNWFGGGTR